MFYDLNANTILEIGKDVPYLSFPALNKLGFIKHGFSTRFGGVSTGVYSSMNLGLNRGDSEEMVYTNYKLLCGSIGIAEQDLVFTDQVHKAEIHIAAASDKGKGFRYQRDYQEIDALITNEPGVPLLVFTADCVPVYLADPVKKAAGLVHAGWKGTVLKISKKAAAAMSEAYHSNPADLTAVIGPSICKSCYEVGNETADAFREAYKGRESGGIVLHHKDAKPHVDLWKANYSALLEAGLRPENIHISGLCTMCRQDLFFSHRAMGNRRGSMAAMLMII